MSFYKKIRKSIMQSVMLLNFAPMFASFKEEPPALPLDNNSKSSTETPGFGNETPSISSVRDEGQKNIENFRATQELEAQKKRETIAKEPQQKRQRMLQLERTNKEQEEFETREQVEKEQERDFLKFRQDFDAKSKILSMQPTDLAKLGQREIKSIGNDITNIPLDTFKKLSEAQTVALTPEQIRAITAKPEYLKALKTEYISPITMYEVIKDPDHLITVGAKNTLISKTTSDQANYMLNQPSLKLSPDLWSVLKKRESYFNTLSRKIRTGTVQGIQRAREALGSARDTIKTIPSKLSENINTALTNDINEVKQKTQPQDVIQFLNDYAAKKSELEKQIEAETITPVNKRLLQEMPSLLAAIKPNALLSAINSIGDDGAETILKDVSAEQADYILNNDPELSAAYKEVLEARESYLNKFGRKAREEFGTTSKAVARSAQTVKEKLLATQDEFSATAKKAVDAINDSLNKNRDFQEASRLTKKSSVAGLEKEESQALERHLSKLTTKEKERVLNEFTQENDIKIKNLATEKVKLVDRLSAMDTKKGLSSEEQSKLEDQISILDAQAKILNTHSELIRQTIKRSLTPNEVLMPLAVDGVKYPTYDIVDMSQINPADPDFAKALDKVASVHFLPNGREGRMDDQTLKNNYVTWIADKITTEIRSTPNMTLDQIDDIIKTSADPKQESISEDIKRAIYTKLLSSSTKIPYNIKSKIKADL